MPSGLSHRLDPTIMCLLMMVVFAIQLAYVLELRQRIARLERVSMFDPLTGLLTQPYFRSQIWPLRLRSAAPLGVLWFDLDNLKAVNDRHGHDAGDALVRKAAEALASLVRGGVDSVVRMHTAGDEFLVVGSLPSHRACVRWALHLQAGLRAHGIAASIGLAWTDSPDYTERAGLIPRAEAKCRAAKNSGGCRLAYDSPPTEDEARQRETSAVPEFVGESAPTRKVFALPAAAVR